MLCNTSPTKKRNITLIILGILSIAVSILFWNTDDTLFVLLRNVPTIVIGLLVVVHFNRQTSSILNHPFKYLGLALILSLLFTIGFELLGQDYPFFIILRSILFKIIKKSFLAKNSNRGESTYILARNSEGLIAMGATCPHKGCTVAIATEGLLCPCHNALFDPKNGAVLRGPASYALDRVVVREADGVIYITD